MFLGPLMVDADTGFGNALNMRRTIRTLERAGADAIQIEDQVFPKRCGHFEGKEVIPAAEMVGKIKAAVDARSDPDLLIVARTDAIAVEGFDAAIERAHAFREAGADMRLRRGADSPEQIAAIARLPWPQLINMVIGGKTPELPNARLKELGFAGVLYANTALQAAVLGMQRALAHLKREHGQARPTPARHAARPTSSPSAQRLARTSHALPRLTSRPQAGRVSPRHREKMIRAGRC